MRNNGIYHILALAAVVIWGTTFVSTKILLREGLSPSEIMFFRFLIAYVVLKAVSLRTNPPLRLRDELLFAAAGISGGSLYFLTENTALQIAPASDVALLLATSPILTVLLSKIWLERTEPFGRSLGWGALLALSGVALVVYNGNFVLDIHPLGNLLTLVASLMWAAYNICLKKLDQRHTTLEITRKVFFYGLLTLSPVFLFAPLRTGNRLPHTPTVLIHLLFLGLVASLFCYAIWNLAVKRLGTVRTSNYIYLVPLVSLLCSALILHEKITPLAIAGAALILGGVYVAEHGLRPKKPLRDIPNTQRL